MKRGSLGIVIGHGTTADHSVEIHLAANGGSFQNIILGAEDRSGYSSACGIVKFTSKYVDLEGLDMDQWIGIDFNEEVVGQDVPWFDGVVSVKGAGTRNSQCVIWFPGLQAPYQDGIVCTQGETHVTIVHVDVDDFTSIRHSEVKVELLPGQQQIK